MTELYPNLDFSSIKPNEAKAEDEQEEEVGQGGIMVDEGVVEGGHGAANEGAVEELVADTPGEVSREEIALREVALGDGNPHMCVLSLVYNS